MATGRIPIRMPSRVSSIVSMNAPPGAGGDMGTGVTSTAGTSAGADGFAPTAAAFFRDLQARICARFESFEDTARFSIRPWNKPEGHRLQGGGESRLMRGEVFEK